MNNIFNISDEDIILFVNSYNKNLLGGTVSNNKINSYVELLKTIKYYRDNDIEFDCFFLKKFNFDNEDNEIILKLLNRIKKGKTLYHKQLNYNVTGCSGTSNKIYSSFKENENYNNAPKFELFSQVESAIDSYNSKMDKLKDKRKNENVCNRNFEETNNNYLKSNTHYNASINNTRTSGFDRFEFSDTNLLNNNNTSNSRFDIINKVLDDKKISNGIFDDEFKTAYPTIYNNKKTCNYTNNTVNRNNPSDRFYQDIQLSNENINNMQGFENNFQHNLLATNQFIDSRLSSSSTRMDNRSLNFKR